MAKERQSNFELLRILCMWGVLTCHVLQNTYDIHVADLTLSNTFRVLLMNCSIVAVNCFILISGYFKINPTWKGVMRLASQISFYVALFAIVGALLSDVDIKTSLVRIIFPLSHSGLWFITAYFGLFLLAPMLNSAFENSSKVQRMLTCLALLIVDVYIGYMHQAPEVTQNGYHLIHFITIYYIGRQVSLLRVNRCKWGGGWSVTPLIMTGLYCVKMLFAPIAVLYSMRYNSPAVMIASIVLFFWVCTWNIRSKAINRISASVLSVYIIHSQPIVSKHFFSLTKEISESNSAVLSFCLIVGAMALLYACCILLDKIRIALIVPIADRVGVWIKMKCDRLIATFGRE